MKSSSIHTLLKASFATMVMASSAAAQPFGPVQDLGSGWQQSSWFGSYNATHYPHIFHRELGWLTVHEANGMAILFDWKSGSWLETRASWYPHLYLPKEGTWFSVVPQQREARLLMETKSKEIYASWRGALMPGEMVEFMEMGSGLIGDEGVSGITDSLSPMLSVALMALMGDPTTLACPSVNITPPLEGLEEMPATIEVAIDFGAGCMPEGLTQSFAGALDLTLQNLALDLMSGNIGMNFSLFADNLTIDGVPMLSGAASGDLNIAVAEEELETETHYITNTLTTLDIAVLFNQLLSLEQLLDGEFSIAGTISVQTVESITDWDDVQETSMMDIVIDMLDFTMDELTVETGQITIKSTSGTVIELDVAMTSNRGPADLQVIMEQDPSSGVVELRSVGQGTVFGYTVEIIDVRMDPMICEEWPVSGEIRVGFGGQLFRMIFNADCTEDFTLIKG